MASRKSANSASPAPSARGRDAAGAVRVEAVLDGTPLVSHEVVNGLTAFAAEHPNWLITSRRGNFSFTARWFRDHHVAGLLAWGNKDAIEAARAAGVPAVALLPRVPRDHPAVDVDDEAVGRMAAEALLERGFERFGYCGIPIA